MNIFDEPWTDPDRYLDLILPPKVGGYPIAVILATVLDIARRLEYVKPGPKPEILKPGIRSREREPGEEG